MPSLCLLLIICPSVYALQYSQIWCICILVFLWHSPFLNSRALVARQPVSIVELAIHLLYFSGMVKICHISMCLYIDRSSHSQSSSVQLLFGFCYFLLVSMKGRMKLSFCFFHLSICPDTGGILTTNESSISILSCSICSSLVQFARSSSLMGMYTGEMARSVALA